MRLENVEDVFPLTPMQEGMLFHSLASDEPGMYVQQLVCPIDADVDAGRLRDVVQRTLDRHPALRTFFVWEGVREPVQGVAREVVAALREEDWRAQDEATAAGKLDELLREERTRGFDLRRPPLSRIALARLPAMPARFVWTFHHALLDGASVDRVLREMADALAGLLAPAGPGRSCRDYVVWLRRRDWDDARQFWRSELEGLSAPVSFPGRARNDARIADTVTRRAPLPDALDDALRSFARTRHFTPATILQAAWAVVLGRYTGTADVTFGVTVSDRPPAVEGSDSTVGLLVNTIPARVRLPRRTPIAEWLGAIQARQAEAREHQSAPLVRIREWCGWPGDRPLFDSVFVFASHRSQGSPAASPLRIGERATWESSNYALNAFVEPTPRFETGIIHDPVRIDARTVEDLLAHWQLVLEAIVTRPGLRVADLTAMLPSAARARLDSWNEGTVPFSDRLVHERVAAQAALHPEAPAVRCDGETLRYGELDRASDELARRLRAMGVGAEDRVAVFLPRSPALAVALLATMKAGGAYVPLDPGYPEEHRSFVLSNSGARVLLTPAAGGNAIRIEPLDHAAKERDGGSRAAHDPSPESLAYVIYTSGSTGRPKGVGVSHRSLANLVEWHQRTFDLRSEDVTTQLAALAFDASVWEIWPSLAAGACLQLPAGDVPASPGELRDWLVSIDATVSFVPTPLAEPLLGLAWPSGTRLRLLLTGGDRLRVHPPAGLPFSVVNNYGPTECTVVATSAALPRDAEDPSGPGFPPIGRPIDNVLVHLLDDDLRPVPVGAVGEIFLGGTGLARGYPGQPGLTAERFLPDPFSLEPGGRLYRTGDLGRFRPDGVLDYVGRNDAQVKIRGYRVEPGEVEAALRTHPGVADAVAITRADGGDGARLVAYAVPRGPSPSGHDLRRFLSGRLPPFMVPSRFVLLDTLPRLPNGKIDRRSLPDEPAAPAADHAGASDVEGRIAGLWAEVLGVPSVALDDNFFDLGGHSLLLVRVQDGIRRSLGRELRIAELFEHPTVRALAGHLIAPGPAPAAAIRERARKQRASLSRRARPEHRG